MKQTVFLIAVLVLVSFLSCQTATGPDAVIKDWVRSMESRDLEGVMDPYLDDAVFISVTENGEESRIVGKTEIREMQKGFIGNPDAVIDIDSSDLKAEMSGDTAFCEVIFDPGGMDIVNRFEMVLHDGRWRIQVQTVDVR